MVREKNTFDSISIESDQAANTEVTVYSARLVIPITAPVILNGAVAVYGNRVIHVGTRQWVYQELQDELAQGTRIHEYYWHGILMPGLVNAHTHLQYTGMEAVGKNEYSNFHDWEQAFSRVYDDPSGVHDWYHWSTTGARQLVESGTTAAADIVTDAPAAVALKSQGLHGISYWEVMDWSNEDWKNRGRSQLNLALNHMRQEHVESIGISPHAPYTLDSEPFVDLPNIARKLNMRLHIHLAETPLEASANPPVLYTYMSSGWQNQYWESYRDLKGRGQRASAIQFMDLLGSLGPDVHIAHGVWADEEDRRILRQRKVYVALCPRSNRITNTGKDAPIRSYLEEGNPLAIGTDSLSSSPSLDLMDECAAVYDLARSQGYQKPDLSHRLLHMLTLGGAAAMGLHVGANRIGQINTGALADLAFFDIPVTSNTPNALEETFENLVRYGGGTNQATVLSGSLVYGQNKLDSDEVLV